MSPKLLLALLSLLAAFSACNNADDEDVYKPILPVPLIKTMTVVDPFDGLTYISSFEYDELNRITKMEINGFLYEKYTYFADTLIMREIYSSTNRILEIDSVRLNEHRLVLSDNRRLFRTNSYEFETRPFTEGIYQYNLDGYLISSDHSYGGYHEAFKIEDGNTVEVSHYQWVPKANYQWGPIPEDKSNYIDTLTQTDNYQHFTTTTNTIGNENMGMAWMGKQNKNLVSEFIRYWYKRGVTASSKVTYSYRYDSQRRVIEKKAISDNGSNIKTYTYY